MTSDIDVLGYYMVGDEKIYHKPSALLRSAQLNISPSWHFNEEIFKKLDWQSDNVADLTHLYKIRAQQLRNQYDYIVVSFSGGSDSWTIMKSFLDSKCQIDEVYVRWPLKLTRGTYTVSRNPNPENVLSEWELTLEPQLKWWQEQMPHTKFTINDYSDRFLNDEFIDDYVYDINDHFSSGMMLKTNSISQTELASINQGKKTCIIFGIDKPQLCVHQGNIYCYFLDKLANMHPSTRNHRKCELFYWNAKVPEIVVSQARAMYRFIKDNPYVEDLILWGRYDPEKKDIWDRIVRNIIYEEYSKFNFFQANKTKSTIYMENNSWMKKYRNILWMQSWENNIKNLTNSISSKWFDFDTDGKVNGFKGFISGWYLLGPASNLGNFYKN